MHQSILDSKLTLSINPSHHRIPHLFGRISRIFVIISGLNWSSSSFRPPDVSRKGLKFYPWTLFSFFFYQSTALSSHAEDGHQMYFGGSVVGKTSTIGIGISSTPILIFTGGVKKCKIWRRLKLNFQPPAFENAARYPNSKIEVQCCDDRPMSRPSLAKLGPRTTEKALVSSDPPPKIARENVLNRR